MRYLTEHSTFNSIAELNTAIYTHITRNYYEMNDTDRTLLKQLARYAVKYRGAAQLKADTLAGLLEVNVKTVRRGLTKLQTLGIIEKRTTLRKVNGGYGANIIVILPPANAQASLFDNDVQSAVSSRANRVEPTESKAQAMFEPTESTTSLKREIPKSTYKDTEKRAESQNTSATIYKDLQASVPASILADAIPAPLFEAMTRYFGDAESVYKYFGVILRAKASVAKTVLIEHDPAAFVKAWHGAVLAWKTGKVRKNFEVLLYGAMKRATATVLANSTYDNHIVRYDWLTPTD